MAKKFTPEQTLRLVTLYRDHECLWDINSDNYKNPYYKQRALKQMCSDMDIEGFTVDDLRLKIRTIRSTYRIELDKIEKSLDTDHIYTPKVIWFETLNSYIKDVTMRKKKVPALETYKYSNDEDSDSDYNIEEQNDQELEHQDFTEEEYLTEINEPETKKRKVYRVDTASNTVNLVNDTENYYEPTMSHNTPKSYQNLRRNSKLKSQSKSNTYEIGMPDAPDEFDVFGKHVASQLRQLSTLHYVMAQEEIQSTLTKFRMEDMAHNI